MFTAAHSTKARSVVQMRAMREGIYHFKFSETRKLQSSTNMKSEEC